MFLCVCVCVCVHVGVGVCVSMFEKCNKLNVFKKKAIHAFGKHNSKESRVLHSALESLAIF